MFGGAEYVRTVDLLDALHALDDAPWSEWYGKPLSARALAKLLAPYRVSPQHRRVSTGEDVRGYFRADLADVWQRYVSLQGPVTHVTSATKGDFVSDVADVTIPQTLFDPEYATDDDGEVVS